MDSRQFAEFMEVQKSLLERIVNQQGGSSESSNDTAARVTVNTTLLPNFECFDSKKESFRNYKSRFENYLDMKNIKNEKEYSAKLLLNSIGAKYFNMITALAAPKLPTALKYDELIKFLEEHLAPKKNVLVVQHQFLSRYQTD